MKQWTQTLQATVEFVSEMVDREWRTQEEWQNYSAVQRSLFAQMGQWLEAFAGQPLFEPWGAHREEQRLLARQVRDELFLLLAEMEPAQAMAVLSSLPAAQVLGYQQDRLAALLTVESAHVQAWEQEGFARLRELVSPHTPLLLFITQRVREIGGAVVEPLSGQGGGLASGLAGGQSTGGQAPVVANVASGGRANGEGRMESARSTVPAVRAIRHEDLTLLLQEARVRPHFDLRQFVTPALELSIRQAVHQQGLEAVEQVQSLFANEDHAAVQLVAERMKVEMSGGREERGND
jgi:hypothetical protein